MSKGSRLATPSAKVISTASMLKLAALLML
jgi:hypothetical protein